MNGKCCGFDAVFVEGQNPKINLQNVWRTSRSFGIRSKTDGNIPQYSALSTPKITISSIFLKIFSDGLKMAKLRKMRLDIGVDFGNFGKLAPGVCASQSVHGFDGLNGARTRTGDSTSLCLRKSRF